MNRDELLRLVERLERMIAEPAWRVFYMQKDEAAACAAALRALAGEG